MIRQNTPERMDAPERESPALLKDDLRNLEVLNRLFGGRRVVRRRVGALLEELPPKTPLRVLDIGSGAGDLCRVLVDECRRRDHPVQLASLDAYAPIQAYARDACRASYPEIRFLLGDAREVPLAERSVDLALCTLALHHFSETDALAVLAELRRVSMRWCLVSDLCRSELAYAGVWLATRFSPNAMTRYDGPVSVRRAFTTEELRELARRAGWRNSRLLPEPWFRMTLLERLDA